MHHLLLLPQRKDLAPKKPSKRALRDGNSPPQASRKRKAPQLMHTSTGTASLATASSSPGQLGPAIRHNRLKSIARRHKGSTPSDATPCSTSGAAVPHTATQKSCSGFGAQPADCSSAVPSSTLEACVGGTPHTQLVLSTVQHLRRTLSSEPQESAPPQESAQLSKPTPAITVTSAANAVAAVPAAIAEGQAQGLRHTEQGYAHQSMAEGPSPMLEPFLVARVSGNQADPDSGRDQVKHQQGPVSTKEAASVQLDSVSPSGRHPVRPSEAGERQAVRQAERQAVRQTEGQSDRQSEWQVERQADWQAEGQPEGQQQHQKAVSPEEEISGCLPRMRMGSALQQLISRAQKLKEQLDAHAAGKHHE